MRSVVNTVENKVTETVHKVEEKAVDVAQSAKSAFESKPAPPAPPSAPVARSPAVSARSVALNPALLRNELSVASGSPKDAADALIRKHTAWYGNLYEENLGDEMADMARKGPTRAATINAVSQKLSDGDLKDVATRMAKLPPDEMRKLAPHHQRAAARRHRRHQARRHALRRRVAAQRHAALGRPREERAGDRERGEQAGRADLRRSGGRSRR